MWASTCSAGWPAASGPPSPGRLTQYGFPAPGRLAGADPAELRALGFSTAKARTIIAVAGQVAAGTLDLEALRDADDDRAMATLLALPGIGRWSAEYVMLRGLARYHVLPGDDVGARNNLRRRFGLAENAGYDAVASLSRRWQPYAGLVYFHLLLDALAARGDLEEARWCRHRLGQRPRGRARWRPGGCSAEARELGGPAPPPAIPAHRHRPGAGERGRAHRPCAAETTRRCASVWAVLRDAGLVTEETERRGGRGRPQIAPPLEAVEHVQRRACGRSPAPAARRPAPGKASSTMMEATSMFHVKIGIRNMVMPGARK